MLSFKFFLSYAEFAFEMTNLRPKSAHICNIMHQITFWSKYEYKIF